MAAQIGPNYFMAAHHPEKLIARIKTSTIIIFGNPPKKEKSAKNLRIKMGDVFRCFHLDIKDRVIFAIKLSIFILG